jgi:arylsulfatase
MFGGWSFYLKDGKPVAYASAAQLPGQQSRIAAAKPIASGHNHVRFEFVSSGEGDGGVLTISVNGTEVARGNVTHRPHVPAGIGETFDTGRDSNVPVSNEYQHEGVFTGEIKKIEIEVKPPQSPRMVDPYSYEKQAARAD